MDPGPTGHIPGIEISRRFYDGVVRPILAAEFPKLRHSAALIGAGSEVLGFDTEMSSDHAWGPRVLIFLDEDGDTKHVGETVNRLLPDAFQGHPIRSDSEAEVPGILSPGVAVNTCRGYFQVYLNFSIDREIEPADWLTFSEQKLRSIGAGAVFHDEVGLQAIRDRFTYYPHDVWIYLLAAGWMRIAQEQHLMGRAGYVGDELGASLIGSRLVRDIMQLCFLMERQFAPYPKWFGTAFARLACAGELSPILRRVQLATSWQEREEPFCAACLKLAAMHDTLEVTEPLSATIKMFFTRPFRVIDADTIVRNLREAITDPAVNRIALERMIGGIDQFSDSTDLVSHARWRPMLRSLFEGGSQLRAHSSEPDLQSPEP
jgi:hypothetical protein